MRWNKKTDYYENYLKTSTAVRALNQIYLFHEIERTSRDSKFKRKKIQDINFVHLQHDTLQYL